MRRLPLLFIAFAPAAFAQPVAGPDWYAVEVIVFAHRADASRTDERWPPDPGSPPLDAAVDLVAPTIPATLQPFEQLPADALALGGALRTLRDSSRYEPLVHAGWLQPGLSPDDAVPVRITPATGEPLAPIPLAVEPDDGLAGDVPGVGDDGDVVKSADDPFPESPPEDVPDKEAPPMNPWLAAETLRVEHPAPPEPERVQGTVTLILQRFLHVEADLLLASDEPLPDDESPDWHTARETILTDLVFERIGVDEARVRLAELDARPRVQAFRLRESRRVRSGELHYFDHPRVGVVVLVRPVSPEEVDARMENAVTASEATPPTP